MSRLLLGICRAVARAPGDHRPAAWCAPSPLSRVPPLGGSGWHRHPSDGMGRPLLGGADEGVEGDHRLLQVPVQEVHLGGHPGGGGRNGGGVARWSVGGDKNDGSLGWIILSSPQEITLACAQDDFSVGTVWLPLPTREHVHTRAAKRDEGECSPPGQEVGRKAIGG